MQFWLTYISCHILLFVICGFDEQSLIAKFQFVLSYSFFLFMNVFRQFFGMDPLLLAEDRTLIGAEVSSNQGSPTWCPPAPGAPCGPVLKIALGGVTL